MEFRILGPIEVSDDGRKLALGGPKQRAVLAHLILRANRVVAADLLIDGLWGEEPPESARNTLQTYVYQPAQSARRGSDRGSRRRLRARGCSRRDRRGALRSVGEPGQGPIPRPRPPACPTRSHCGARTGWPTSRRNPRSGVRPPGWRSCGCRRPSIAAEIAMGGHSTVVPELESLTARYPLRERMWASLMLALFRSGRQAEALSTYDRARQVLADELGADPSPELRRLHEQILNGVPAIERPEPAPPRLRPSRVDMQPGMEGAGYRIVARSAGAA